MISNTFSSTSSDDDVSFSDGLTTDTPPWAKPTAIRDASGEYDTDRAGDLPDPEAPTVDVKGDPHCQRLL